MHLPSGCACLEVAFRLLFAHSHPRTPAFADSHTPTLTQIESQARPCEVGWSTSGLREPPLYRRIGEDVK